MVILGLVLATAVSVILLQFECIEAPELLGMVLAHLQDAEATGDLSPRVPLLMSIRDKLAKD